MSNLPRLAVLALVVSSALAAPVRARERRVTAGEVPAAVRDAVNRKYGGARVVGYAREDERGATSYEVSVEIEGRRVDVGVAPGGRILVEEQRIAMADLPVEVARALAASPFGRWQVRRVERIVENERAEDPRFELSVRDGRKTVELTFDGNGRLLGREVVHGAD
jgi:hypothetical protein